MFEILFGLVYNTPEKHRCCVKDNLLMGASQPGEWQVVLL